MQSVQVSTPTTGLVVGNRITFSAQPGVGEGASDKDLSEKSAFLTKEDGERYSPLGPKWTIMNLTPDATYLVLRLCAVWFFCINAWAMLQAAIPLMLKDLLGPAKAANWQGILTFTTAMSGLFVGTALGYFSDRIGRVMILTLWTAVFTLGVLGVIYTEKTGDLTGVVVGRLGTLTVPTTMLFALTSDFAQGKTLLQVHGYIGASFGTALMIGSGLSAVLGRLYGRHTIFWAAMVSAACGAVIAWTTKPALVGAVLERGPVPYVRKKRGDEDSQNPTATSIVHTNSNDDIRHRGTTFLNVSPLPQHGPACDSSHQRVLSSSGSSAAPLAKPPQPTSFIQAVRTISKDPLLLCNVVAFGVVRVGNVNTFMMFVLYTNWRLQWGIMDTSLALGFVGGLAVLWQALGVKYVVDRVDQHYVVSILLAVLVGYPAMMIGYGLVQTTAHMYWVFTLGSVTSIAPAIFTAKITTLAGQEGIAGSALGVVGSVTCLLELPASYLFARLLSFALVAYDTESFGAGLPYFANSLVYGVALLLILVADKIFDRGHVRAGWRKAEAADQTAPLVATGSGRDDTPENKLV